MADPVFSVIVETRDGVRGFWTVLHMSTALITADRYARRLMDDVLDQQEPARRGRGVPPIGVWTALGTAHDDGHHPLFAEDTVKHTLVGAWRWTGRSTDISHVVIVELTPEDDVLDRLAEVTV